MKRRSARPFMVEVKSTRAARASLTSPNLRTRPDTILWPELIEAEAKPPQPDMPLPTPPRQERKEAEAPVRRVLPSLVPMFQVPEETENGVEAELEAVAPPVRRSRTRRERGPAVDKAAAVKAVVAVKVAAPAPEPVAKPHPAAARPEPAGAPAVHVPAVELAQGPSHRPAPWRRTKELRLGERWKRRLPYFAR